MKLFIFVGLATLGIAHVNAASHDRGMPDRDMPDRDRNMPDRDGGDSDDRDMGDDGGEGGERPPRVWTFGIGRAWPPFNYLDTEQRKVVGLGVDMIHAACRVAHQHCAFVYFKEYSGCWDNEHETSSALFNHHYDACIDYTPTFDRSLVVAFSHAYARDIPGALYVRSNDNLRVEDLRRDNELTVGFVEGVYLNADCLRNKDLEINEDRIRLYFDMAELREALRNGQIRVAFAQRHDADPDLFKELASDQSLTCALGGRGESIMTRKDNEELLHWLNPAIDHVMSSPEYPRMCYIWEQIFDMPTNCYNMEEDGGGNGGNGGNPPPRGDNGGSASPSESSDTCVVGQWGPWSECRGGMCGFNGTCEAMTDEEKAQGEGRRTMAKIRACKDHEHEEQRRCRAEHTCPEFNPYVSQGAMRCRNGTAGVFPCRNIDLLALVDFEDLGFPEDGVSGNELWGWNDGNDYYAIMGLSHGVSFVRITNPYRPEVVGILRTHTITNFWRDMKVLGNYAYITSEAENHGLQVFDLKRLRGLSPTKPVREFSEDGYYGAFGNGHNLATNEELQKVMVLGANETGAGFNICGGGLMILDVSDPVNPVFDKCLGIDGYVHDTLCMIYRGPDLNFYGKHICFGFNEDSFTIFDVEAAPADIIISRTSYEGIAYCHQGWFTADMKWLIANDEYDELEMTFGDGRATTYIWNMMDLTNPLMVKIFRSALTTIDHNLYVIGNKVYQSNFEAGLRVLEFDDEAVELEEIAYFDVFPPRTGLNFSGTWGNFPFLPDNTIAVSSIDYGLFILRLDTDSSSSDSHEQERPYGEASRYREALHGSDPDDCPHLVETRKCRSEGC